MNNREADLVMMHDGRVVIRRQGTTTPLKEELLMPGGVRVTVDGHVTLPDGSTRVLTEGETVNTEGTFSRVEDIMQNKLDED